ncbi:MAG TPA: hypothetical protein VG757_07150 [Devosia sp.]|nr:hypothetical protein [Devosia sp.]
MTDSQVYSHMLPPHVDEVLPPNFGNVNISRNEGIYNRARSGALAGVAWPLDMLEEIHRDALAEHQGAVAYAMGPATADLDEARRAEGFFLSQARAAGIEPAEEQVAPYANATAAKKSLRDEAQLRTKETNEARGVAEDYLSLAYDYLATTPEGDIKSLPVRRSADPDKDRAKAQSIAREVDAEEQRITSLQPPQSETLATAHANLKALAVGGDDWRVNLEGQVTPPMLTLEASGNVSVKSVPNTLAILLSDSAVFARVKAQVTEGVRQLYVGVKDTATVVEKQKRLAECRLKRLEAHRIEVAAVLELRRRGYRIGFRKGLDIRAVLNIDGPPFRRRRA